jgi:hypothetical protein
MITDLTSFESLKSLATHFRDTLANNPTEDLNNE